MQQVFFGKRLVGIYAKPLSAAVTALLSLMAGATV